MALGLQDRMAVEGVGWQQQQAEPAAACAAAGVGQVTSLAAMGAGAGLIGSVSGQPVGSSGLGGPMTGRAGEHVRGWWGVVILQGVFLSVGCRWGFVACTQLLALNAVGYAWQCSTAPP